MSNQRDQVLQNLTTKYPYIEYASLVSDQAEFLNQPAGTWPSENEEDIEIIIGKILYIFREMSVALRQEGDEQEEVEQIWIKLERGHFIVLRCSPEAFLVIRANHNSYLGELRKVVEGTAKAIQQLLEAEDNLQQVTREENLKVKRLSAEEYKSSISLTSTINSPGKLRGRDFIE